MVLTMSPRLAAVAAILAMVPLSAALGEDAPSKGATSGEAATDPNGSRTSRSGFDDVPRFGGPGSVGAELEADDQIGSIFRLPALDEALQPYFDWKAGLSRDDGLTFGLDYTGLYQAVTDSPGDNEAAGGIFRFFGTWTLLGQDSGNTGSLVYKVENRHNLVTDLAPQALGFGAGSILPTGTAFSDFGWGVTNLYWQQRLLEGRVSLVAGTLDATDYVDVYGLTNPWTQFQNLAFLTDPTIPVPDQGLGIAGGAMATDNLYVTAGLADANGDPNDAGFDTFFDDREYFKHLEVGWTSSQDRIYLDNVHLTAWQVDQRDEAGVPDGWGLAFSAAWFLDDTWLPFLRGGYGHGNVGLMSHSLAAGVGWFFPDTRDLLGLGVGWGRPSDGTLDDQGTAELFYRLQLTQNLALTPSVQLILDPPLNPDENAIGVFGLRARVAL